MNNKTLKKKFSIDVSPLYYKELSTSADSAKNLYIKKLTLKKSSKNDEINVPWDFMTLKQMILDKIPKRLYGWYHENTSSCGNSTFSAIDAFSTFKIKPDYLNPDKSFSFIKHIKVSSKELGTTTVVP